MNRRIVRTNTPAAKGKDGKHLLNAVIKNKDVSVAVVLLVAKIKKQTKFAKQVSVRVIEPAMKEDDTHADRYKKRKVTQLHFSDSEDNKEEYEELKANSEHLSYVFFYEKKQEPFCYITSKTDNNALKRVFAEQKKSAEKKSFDPLVLVEIRTEEDGQQVIRKLGCDEATPQHGNSAYYKMMQRKIPRQTYMLENENNAYVEPNEAAIQRTYTALSSLLGNDCECFESMKVALNYYEYWRPMQPKVILLAESHVSTPHELSCNGPVLDKSKLAGYEGPVDFCSLVHCLGYGENTALMNRDSSKFEPINDKNVGTWQFWNLLSACVSSPGQELTKGKDILKSSRLTDVERIQRKLEIMKEMQEKGIWLIDTSIVGWYIPQETCYDIAKQSKKVTKLPSLRPHPSLKTPCLRISWEGFVKNLVRKATKDGQLKILIPIGKDVEKILGMKRLKDAVAVEGVNVTVSESYPAPNARLHKGCFNECLTEIAKKVRKVTST